MAPGGPENTHKSNPKNRQAQKQNLGIIGGKFSFNSNPYTTSVDPTSYGSRQTFNTSSSDTKNIMTTEPSKYQRYMHNFIHDEELSTNVRTKGVLGKLLCFSGFIFLFLLISSGILIMFGFGLLLVIQEARDHTHLHMVTYMSKNWIPLLVLCLFNFILTLAIGQYFISSLQYPY